MRVFRYSKISTMYSLTIRQLSTSPISKLSVMVSLLQTFMAFITILVWGVMEVGVVEVGVIEMGEMEVGAMEVKVVEMCWNEQLWQGRQPRLISTLLLLLSPFLCESLSSPQCTHIPDSIFLLHVHSLMNPPIPAATPPLSLSSTRSPIPASLSSSSLTCLHPRLHLLHQCAFTNKSSHSCCHSSSFSFLNMLSYSCHHSPLPP